MMSGHRMSHRSQEIHLATSLNGTLDPSKMFRCLSTTTLDNRAAKCKGVLHCARRAMSQE